MDNAGVRSLGDDRRAGAPMRVVAAGDSARMDKRSAEEEDEGWTPAGGSKTRPRGTSSRPEHTLDSRQQSDLVRSIQGLRSGAPHLSAHTVLSTWQRNALAGSVVVLVGCLLMDAVLTLQLLIGLASVGYCFTVVYRIVLVRGGMASRYLVRVSDADAWAVPDDELPIYTVLVPAYREPEVIGKVIRSVAALEYPTDRLDVRLLLEADDEETIAAADRELGHPSVRKVLVPPVQPRTKPKACNFGLLTAPGEFVTIYDAEDRPEPLQLRRAVVALRRLGARYACVQAQLGYFNAHQNRITRWFAVEYGNWFRLLLPGLVSVGARASRGHKQSLPSRPAAGRGLMGRLQRHGGRRSRHPAGPARLPNRGSRFRDRRGGKQRLYKLGEAAQPLVQGVSANLVGSHAFARSNKSRTWLAWRTRPTPVRCWHAPHRAD